MQSLTKHPPGADLAPTDAALTDEQIRHLDLIPSLHATLDQVLEILRGRAKEFYTVDEFAELVGRASYTVRTWIRQGQITATRVHGTGPRGRLLIPHAEIAKAIASGRGTCIPGAAVEQQLDSHN